jgi:hypothetical protein
LEYRAALTATGSANVARENFILAAGRGGIEVSKFEHIAHLARTYRSAATSSSITSIRRIHHISKLRSADVRLGSQRLELGTTAVYWHLCWLGKLGTIGLQPHEEGANDNLLSTRHTADVTPGLAPHRIRLAVYLAEKRSLGEDRATGHRPVLGGRRTPRTIFITGQTEELGSVRTASS